MVTLVLSLVSGQHTAFLRGSTGVPWVSLLGPTSVPSDAHARWRRERSANPVCAVGASPVVLSSFANVLVILVFCDMLEYLHSCSTTRRRLASSVVVF